MSIADVYVKIILAIISIISALISYYVIPYLKNSTYVKQFSMLNAFIIDSVRAANQLYPADKGEDKKYYVTELVLNFVNRYNLGFTEDHIDAIIEGVVKEVKNIDKK